MKNVYVDNAATTPMSLVAYEAMAPYCMEIYGNPSSLHTTGQIAADALRKARKMIASCLGCDDKEIIFTSGGSEADNQAIMSAAVWGARKGKRHIVSTTFEHHAVLHTLHALEAQGYEVTYLDVHENGIITPEQVANAITENTCLVTIMYANNEIGTIQPVAEIGKICHEKNVFFHTDAVQAVGHLHIDVKKEQIDMLSLSAHKFHGPKGIGALYIRRGIPPVNLIYGGAQERGKRAGTENIPAIMSMAAALSNALENLEQKQARLIAMRDRLINALSEIPHSATNGDLVQRLPGNASFCFEGIEGESMLLLLDAKGIRASSGSACTSGSLDPSHVLLAIGRPHEVAHGSLRISLSDYNTEEEIDYLIKEIPATVAYLRSISPVWRDLQEGKRSYVIQ